ncbi:MAG: hypothetical protein A2X32_01955 [Elusimicrobia bacterium GWC2_64_44]|nr:MAG: hypothetical protein A2X32_01955 [Elusimicrobia bacterium GWC2_64_44]
MKERILPILACLAALFLTPRLAAEPALAPDGSLMQSLRFEMEMEDLVREAVLGNKEGAALAAGLAKPGKLPRVLFSDLEQLRGVVKKAWNALYYNGDIYISKSRMLRYFGAEGRQEEEVDWPKLRKDLKRKKAAAREMAFAYVHELVHVRQGQNYPAEAMPEVESEHEAFLLSSLYFLEETEKDPSLLARHAVEPVYGNKKKTTFASSAAVELFLVCLGKKGYKDYLENIYRGAIAAADGPVDGDDPQRLAFTRSVDALFERAWPGLWLRTAVSGGGAALAAGSYPRALRCLVPPAGEGASYGLPAEKLVELSALGEKALAAALAALRAGEKGDFERHSYLFREMEEAHRRLGRQLPADIAALRPAVYARARIFYAQKAAAEPSAGWRGYLLNQEQYFTER